MEHPMGPETQRAEEWDPSHPAYHSGAAARQRAEKASYGPGRAGGGIDNLRGELERMNGHIDGLEEQLSQALRLPSPGLDEPGVLDEYRTEFENLVVLLSLLVNRIADIRERLVI